MAKHLANDGQYYTDEQYEAAGGLVRAHCKNITVTINWRVTGAIAGFTIDDKPFEYYMRDLVLGIVREDGYDDYRKAVEQAGLV